MNAYPNRDDASMASDESYDGPLTLPLTYCQPDGSADGHDGVCQVLRLPSNQEIIDDVVWRCSNNDNKHISVPLSLLTIPGEALHSAINRYKQSSPDNPDFLMFTIPTNRDDLLWVSNAKKHPLLDQDTHEPNGETYDVGIIAVVPLLTLSSFGEPVCESTIGDVTNPTSTLLVSKSAATEDFAHLCTLNGRAPDVRLRLYGVQPLPSLRNANLEQRGHGFVGAGSPQVKYEGDALPRRTDCTASPGVTEHIHDSLDQIDNDYWMSKHAFQVGYTLQADVSFNGETYPLTSPILYDKNTLTASPPRVYLRGTIGAKNWQAAVPESAGPADDSYA